MDGEQKPALDQSLKDYEDWCRAHNLGSINSPTSRQLYENRALTVEAYVGKFRKGGVKGVLPSEAKNITVAEALKRGRIGNVNVRKLITDLRDKFV